MANPNAVPPPGFESHPERINREGRPRKYYSTLVEQGYKKSEVTDAIQALMSMDEGELKEVLDNDKATVLEKTVAKAIIKSLEKGTLYSMETLLTRVYGQPKQEIEQEIKGNLRIEIIKASNEGSDK